VTAKPAIPGRDPRPVTTRPAVPERDPPAQTAKPTVSELGIDPDAQSWRGSGAGDGAIEIAFARGWVLMRVVGDPGGRVLVFDRHEWGCFLDGARNGEFDDAASP
jgi:hypothetical protein